ncbi:MAG: hypothetical protein GWP19_06995 [Planctomycetia bacterium]|nr:hypothetical protein [Planctomycetia bacterium]
MSIKLPKNGLIFWPIGNGDSTTVRIEADEIIMQIDLNHMASAEDEDDEHYPIVDELIQFLPRKNGKPYLSIFVLTHPDQDHINGFKYLLEKALIGEIWHTPRVFREFKKDLCDDAKTFKDEVIRRRDLNVEENGAVEIGDMLRVIGHDDIFDNSDDYEDFPEYWHSYPGNIIDSVHGSPVENFKVFIHAPFKEDSASDRNNTSLAMQVEIKSNEKSLKSLFFGDREYPTIKQIFDITEENDNEEYLEWDILLAPHHCSKKVMYWKDENDDDEEFKSDIIDAFEKSKNQGGYIIASCESDFSDEDGKNPPHMKARKRFEEIVDSGHFLCTHENDQEDEEDPIIINLADEGISIDNDSDDDNKSTLGSAISIARGEDKPPTEKVGFGLS